MIVEGLPAGPADHGRGDPGRAGPPPARLRPRAPHALRAGRGHAARRRPPRPHARVAGRHRDRQQRVGPQPTSGTRRCRRRRARTEHAAHPAPARPRRPGRHAEVRLHRRPRRARAGLRPRDRGAGGRRRGGQGCCSARSASTVARHVIQMGAARAEGRRPARARPTSTRSTSRRCAASTRRPRRRWSPRSRRRPRRATRSAASSRCSAYGVPVGLGSHVHWDRKLDALLAQALMSIQAVKGVEIGDGFEVAGRRGSEAHDPIVWDADAGALPPRVARWPAASRAACPPASCSWSGRP